MGDKIVRIPPLSIEAPNETARDTLHRHVAVLVGIGKLLLVGSLIQILVLGTTGAIALYFLDVSKYVGGWMVILSWFLAAYLIKLYGRSIFPVNTDQFTQL
ncbi:hypothetical protein [Haladaptatus salinisoli]|uniref:hypothetical protein n=1 Tax=Haladaptatus salinisoli TaxID=2884876 RepID=UPI001D0B613F|nr:hypothetical protein [Haladaptatus salinisoli]